MHLAADGRTLARYDEARAEIEATGGIAQDRPSGGRGFFAFLFGGGRDEEDDAATEAAPPRRGWMATAPGRRRALAWRAGADRGGGNDDGGRNLFVAQAYREARRPSEEAERNLPRGETYLSATPAVSQTNSKVAALEPKTLAAIEASPADASPHATLPLPPRRPEELTTASIPWPPLRPVQLATVISAPVPRVAAYAADMSLDRGAAIRSLIEATQGAREPRGAALPTVITSGASKPEKASSQAMALAYAPAGGATTGLRAVALGRPVPVAGSRRPRGFRRRSARPVELPRAHRT